MSIAPRILLVEDEESLRMTLIDRLESERYAVSTEADGRAGFERALREPFDLLILDVSLPSKNGFDICRDLRQKNVTTPILMLTARSQVIDRVLGLKLGADDYLTKPFDVMELLARIEALLRRPRNIAAANDSSYFFGDVRIDFRSAEVQRSGAAVDLSALEFKLLRFFVERRGELLSRDELLEKVWGYDVMPTTRTVDVHVAALRQKLEANPSRPQFIVTVHRLGYKFLG